MLPPLGPSASAAAALPSVVVSKRLGGSAAWRATNAFCYWKNFVRREGIVRRDCQKGLFKREDWSREERLEGTIVWWETGVERCGHLVRTTSTRVTVR
jgi:hypothetical protein